MSLSTLYFSAEDRHLYGMYDPSTTGGDHGVVLCAPWGQEYLRAHQSMRHLARLLAREGLHAFRFDYFGTGDSDGADTDGSMQHWIEDTAAAIDELTDTAGLRRVSVIGLRVGAAIGAMAAARRAVHRMVFWDPIFDGRAYMQSLFPLQAATAQSFPVQIAGFPVAERMLHDVSAISPDSFGHQLPPTLIISTESTDTIAPLASRLRERGVDVTTEFHAGPRAWREAGNTGSAGMPVVALRAIVRWLAA